MLLLVGEKVTEIKSFDQKKNMVFLVFTVTEKHS